MPPKTKEKHDVTTWKNTCNKENKILNNQIDEGKWNKGARQQKQNDLQHFTDEVKCNKEAMQLRLQDAIYQVDKGKWIYKQSSKDVNILHTKKMKESSYATKG